MGKPTSEEQGKMEMLKVSSLHFVVCAHPSKVVMTKSVKKQKFQAQHPEMDFSNAKMS